LNKFIILCKKIYKFFQFFSFKLIFRIFQKMGSPARNPALFAGFWPGPEPGPARQNFENKTRNRARPGKI